MQRSMHKAANSQVLANIASKLKNKNGFKYLYHCSIVHDISNNKKHNKKKNSGFRENQLLIINVFFVYDTKTLL